MIAATDRSARNERMLALLKAARVIPVLTIEHAADAVPLARALVAGGIKTLEITLRTRAAAEAARLILHEVEGAIVGLGTVLTPHDLDTAEALGAVFAVSPGATPALLQSAASRALPFAPGVQTSSDIMAASEAGFTALKFFPALPAGGLSALRALGGPFPHVSFCPTGGLKQADAKIWLAEPNVVAVGGSWLTPTSLLHARDFAAITALAHTTLDALSR